jgi:hypothetical protein
MIRIYGIVGALMVLFAQVNFYLKIQPFALWYFPIIWFGYIFLIDALVNRIKGRSLIRNNFKLFMGLLFLSSLIWWMFEFFNNFLLNWNYIGTSSFSSGLAKNIFGIFSFATVIPAIFETFDLFKCIHLFDRVKLKKKHNLTKGFLYGMMISGFVCLVLTIAYPKYFFPLVWLTFFLILDPFNYMHKHPSIVGHLKDRKLKIPITLFLAGLACGFLWEFWNYWAIPKWTYHVPYVDFLKIFEMPLLGYLGYGPFAFELYAIYYFVKGLFGK